jgi:hypothetical protein
LFSSRIRGTCHISWQFQNQVVEPSIVRIAHFCEVVVLLLVTHGHPVHLIGLKRIWV